MLGLNSKKAGEWATISLHLPGEFPQKIGILLWDNQTDQLHFQFRPNWWSSLEDDGWSELGQDLAHQAREMGPAKFFGYLESASSHVLRLDERQAVRAGDADSTLAQLYIQHVGKPLGANQLLPVRRLDSAAPFPWRWAFACAAASVSVAAFISASIGSKPSIRTLGPASGYAMIDLPAIQGRQLLLPTLPPRIQSVRRVVGGVPVSVRHFHADLSAVRIPVPVIRVEVPPPPELSLAIAAISEMPANLPQPPQYVLRHNWLIRVFTVIASSFRNPSKAESPENGIM